jgi:cobalt/nickel transport protein
MTLRFAWSLSLLCLLAPVSLAQAHYTMLLPETPSAKKGVPVTLINQWGHPFEHQLFDAAPPTRFTVFAPDSKEHDLTKSLDKVKVVASDNKAVTAYRLRFTPPQRGDYTFVLSTPPVWMEEDKEFLQDTVQVVLHVQAQKGWDVDTGKRFKLVPLTRPYGLLPGAVFQAQVLAPDENGAARPQSGTLVEVEHYNARPPLRLPPDELITRTYKTDPGGVVTCTLSDPGWWCITAQRQGLPRDYQSKRYPLKERISHWVYVEKTALLGPAK